jgi:transposase-like protein
MTLGEQMRATTRKTFSAEFKHEAAQLVLDKNHTIIEAAKAMNVGKSTMGKWVRLMWSSKTVHKQGAFLCCHFGSRCRHIIVITMTTFCIVVL